MVAVVEVKGGVAGGSVHNVIVRKFCRCEVEVPIILEGGDIGAEEGDDGFVCILSLSVCLWVVSGGHVEGGTGERGERLPKVGSKARVTVRYDGGGPTV